MIERDRLSRQGAVREIGQTSDSGAPMPLPKNLTTVILCGGKGLRARSADDACPKPLLRLSGRELIRHVMDVLARQGISRFVLATGYRSDLLEQFARSVADPWQVDVVPTPVAAQSWERIAPCRELVGEVFLVTYADGLANVDIPAMLAAHHAQRATCTMAVVPLTLPYGVVRLASHAQVTSFAEKPRMDDLLVNAGFMLFDRSIFSRFPVPGSRDLEREVLPRLAVSGGLFAHRHDGFFRGVDTYKDLVELEQQTAHGHLPWLDPP